MGAELEEAEVALGTTVPGAVPVGPTGGATEGETEKLKLEPGMMGVPVGIGAADEETTTVVVATAEADEETTDEALTLLAETDEADEATTEVLALTEELATGVELTTTTVVETTEAVELVTGTGAAGVVWGFWVSVTGQMVV